MLGIDAQKVTFKDKHNTGTNSQNGLQARRDSDSCNSQPEDRRHREHHTENSNLN